MLRYLLACLPFVCWAGDFYECTSPQGMKSYQLEKCDKGAQQTVIRDDKTPITQRVAVGDQPVTTQIVRAGLNYYGTGAVNGKPYNMMVDTGASFVSMSRDQALFSGIPLRGRPTRMTTANGVVRGIITTAETVSFAGHEVRNVPVVVQLEGKPFPGILLGMSFLKHFDMNMNGAVMSLTRK